MHPNILAKDIGIGDILSVDGLRKSFGGVRALSGVSFVLGAGEVHALVGENGAGKSTLIKILSGAFRADSGTILLSGMPYNPGSPRDAKANGLQVVHQEFNLLPDLTVAENICFEALPRTKFGLLDRAAMNASARAALDAIGLTDVNVRWPISRLGIAQRQLVEIARSLQTHSRILILDEPTATLTERETVRLFGIIRDIRAQGVTVVFVSHHLNEVFAICDRVTVFRSGETVNTQDIAQTTPAEVVRHMVGRALQAELATAATGRSPGAVALELRGLQTMPSRHEVGVSLSLHYGEILGIAGLVGAGRTELLRAIFGADPARSGTILRDGLALAVHAPADAIAAGIGFVTEDRKDEGLILSMPIAANVSLASMDRVSAKGILRTAQEAAVAKAGGAQLQLKYGRIEDPVSSLSGGNQQKVVLAKWLERGPRVLMLDEPTRGVDVGAKAEIYAILRGLADQGIALLIVSSELPELMALSDRIVVLADHQIKGELPRAQFSAERILQLAYNQH